MPIVAGYEVMAGAMWREGFALAQQRRGLAPSTIERRDHALRVWMVWCDGDPWTATTAEVEGLIDTRRAKSGTGGVSAKTRNVWLSTLHAFYAWGIRAGHTDHDPTAAIDRPKLRRALPRPIPDDELAAALAQADALMCAWCTLMAYAGLRCAEVAGLTRERVTPELLCVLGKGQVERLVPTHPAVMVALRSHGMPRSGALFVGDDGRAFTANRVSARVGYHLRRCGSDATPHQLRHWFGTKTYAACRDLRVVQELMGHSSPLTTAGYAAYSRATAEAAVLALAA